MTGNSAQQRKKIRRLLWRWGKVTAFCARRMRVISEYQALMEQAAGLHSSSLNSLPGTKRSGDATGQAAIRLDQLRELFAQRIAEANEDIARELAFAAALDGVKSGPVNRLFYRFQVRAEKFRATENCVGCGKCARLCPLGNIRMEEGRPHWGDRCTHCMACLCGCPTGAIEYGRATKGKERYHFPGPEEE